MSERDHPDDSTPAPQPPALQPPANQPPANQPGRRPNRGRGWLWVAVTVGAVLGLLVAVWLSHRPTAPGGGGKLVYQDDFERETIGDDYRQGAPDPGWQAGTWKIEGGRLHAQRIHNAALWLQVPLPDHVRVEFDARAETADGDVKCEIFGDGKNHQSGYILIFGGWNNTINALARQDEHGEDRKEDSRCRVVPGQRKVCVEPGVDYRWAVERTGDAVRWYLDGALFLTYDDPNPVTGKHFAFNNWEAHVTFDNLAIYDLAQ